MDTSIINMNTSIIRMIICEPRGLEEGGESDRAHQDELGRQRTSCRRQAWGGGGAPTEAVEERVEEEATDKLGEEETALTSGE